MNAHILYGKEFTNIGSIGLKDKKASRITNIKCKLGKGGGVEIRENFTSYPSKITKPKDLQ